MNNHAPEPWAFVTIDSFAGYGKVVDAYGIGLMINIPYGGSAPCNETLKRIVACVNACSGIPDDLLQDDDKNIINRYTQHLRNETIRQADLLAAVTAQRDELLKDLKEMERMRIESIQSAIKKAIAKCEAQNDER